MNYTRKAFFGFAVVAAGMLVANVFGYLLRLVLARNLSVAEYGLVYAVIAFFGLLGVFQHLGLGDAIVQYVSKYGVQRKPEKIRELLFWSFVILYGSTALLALATFLAADWLAAAYFKDAAGAAMVRIFAVFFAFTPLGIILPAWFRGTQRMDLYSLYVVVQSVLLFAATWLFIASGYGVFGAMYAYIVFIVLQHLLFAPVILKAPAMPKSLGLRVPRMLLVYGLPVMLAGVASSLLTFTDTSLLTVLADLEQVGLYQAALPTANILLVFGSVLTTVMLPIFSELAARKELGLLNAALRDLYRYVFVLIVPVALSVLAFPEVVLNLLFGGEYVAGASTLQALSLAVCVITLTAINGAVFASLGVPKENAKTVVAGALFNVLANLLLIPLYGSLGAAIATLVSSGIILAYGLVLLRRRMRLAFPAAAVLRTIPAGLVFTLVLFIGRSLPLGQYLKVGTALLLGLAAYAACVLLLRIVTPDDLKNVFARVFP